MLKVSRSFRPHIPMGGIMMKAKVRLECPRCGVELKCYAREVNANDARWAYTEASYKHLQDASCEVPKPQLTLISSASVMGAAA
jgi:hypothetical protein